MKQLSPQKQQYWLEHSRAAEQSELSLTDYAKQQQLNVGVFYSWRSRLRKEGLLHRVEQKRTAFIKVTLQPLSAPSPICPVNVTLPNGLRIEIAVALCDLAELMQHMVKL
jgi:hypothetical protein